MNYFGTYRMDSGMRTSGICDAPCISKGTMMLAGFDTASNAGCMALSFGHMRNRAALARELKTAPYASAAQILLSAYEKWGEDYVLHVEGGVTSCIADVQREKMVLARDRMGECSVFYAENGGRFMFADHPDMILKSGIAEARVGAQGLCELFAMGPARTPGCTPLEGIKSLQPGCMLAFEGGNAQIRRYFELECAPVDDGEALAAEKVRHLIEQAVGDTVHMHPGCMLSGGLDSTALTAVLCTRIGRVESYSVDYADNDRDFVSSAFRPEKDAPYIRLASKTFGTRHHNVVLEQGALAENLDRAVRFRGFPGMADIDASLYLFAGQIAKRSASVISGECGDEVFGGYPWFRGEVKLPEHSFPWSGSMELRGGLLRREIAEKIRPAEYVSERLHAALDSYDTAALEDREERTLFKLQRLCFDFFMPNLQERASAMCGAQGVTVLTPLCDDRLVRYVYNVPWRLKRRDGVEKALFRESVRDLLPEKLCMRKKSPYPKTCSPTYTELVRQRFKTIAMDEGAPLWRCIDREAALKLAASSLNPADTPWFGQLMAGPQMIAYLIQVNSWMAERNVQIELG